MTLLEHLYVRFMCPASMYRCLVHVRTLFVHFLLAMLSVRAYRHYRFMVSYTVAVTSCMY